MREGKNFWKKFFPSRVFFPTHSSSIASIDLPIEATWAWKFDTKIEKMPALVAGWILNPAASNHNPTSTERLWGKSQKPIGIGGVSPQGVNRRNAGKAAGKVTKANRHRGSFPLAAYEFYMLHSPKRWSQKPIGIGGVSPVISKVYIFSLFAIFEYNKFLLRQHFYQL